MKSKSELLFVTLFVSLQIYFGFLLHISKVVSSLYVKSAKPHLFGIWIEYEFGLWKMNGFVIRYTSHDPELISNLFIKSLTMILSLTFFGHFDILYRNEWLWDCLKNLGNVREVQGEIMSCLSYFQCFFAGSFWRIACSSICVHNHDNQRGDGYILCLHSKAKIILFERQVHHTNCQQCWHCLC